MLGGADFLESFSSTIFELSPLRGLPLSVRERRLLSLTGLLLPSAESVQVRSGAHSQQSSGET